MEKRILQFGMMVKVVMIAMLLGMVGMTKGYSYESVLISNLWYHLENSHYTATVAGHKDWESASGNLIIPESVSYNGSTYSVIAIGEAAFANCRGLIGNLNLPNTVASIDEWAFAYCTGFNGTLTIPSSVTTIGETAFYNSGFTEVHYNATNCSDIVDNPPYYVDGAFMGCNGNLIIGENVERIPANIFRNCTGFTGDLTIPNSVSVIGERAFAGCSGFSGILTIGSSVTAIGGTAFSGLNGLSEVHFNPTHCTICGDGSFYAFSECTGTLLIGDNVTIIPNDAFNGASFHGTLTIGNSVTRIGSNAFSFLYPGFTGDLLIPNSVTEIGVSAFSYAGFDGELVLPNTITIIEGGTFVNCGFTGNLTIPENITTIGMSAFDNCSGFTSELVLPESLTLIEAFAFNNCSGFSGCLTIPNSVTQIQSMAFNGCSGLSCISIPNSVESIGENVFGGTDWWNNHPDGILYLDDWCLGYKGNPPTGALSFQEGTKGIAGWAFQWCENLTGILTIPESIEHIGDMAFLGCTGFSELEYNAVSIDWVVDPFTECSGLQTLRIGNHVEKIPSNAFYNCSSFTGSLTIPNSVISIGHDAFYNCSGFVGELVIPNSVVSINSDAFYGCIGFNGDLTIPNSVTSIGSYAFYGCTGFTNNLTISNSVTSIGGGAFYGCSGLTSVIIGNSVASIGVSAFRDCSNISSITVFAETPPTLTIGYNGTISVFTNVDKSIPVYVPYGTMTTYQAAPGWNEFTTYQEMPPVNTTQTVELIAGWNWFSPNIEITLDDLKASLVSALPNTNITIKSKNNGSTTYNGTTWRGQLTTLDLTQMYRISVSTACEISLEGMPINPANYPITIHNGANWIAFPFSESKSLNDAFAGFAVNGDVVKSKSNGIATYNGTQWRGTLNMLVPGQGYIYKSNVQGDRTFTFPTGTK